MQDPSATTGQRHAWRAGRAATGILVLLGLAGLATTPGLAAALWLRLAALLGASSLAAVLLGTLARSLIDARRLVGLLADNGRDVVARLGPAGEFLYASPATLAMLGYPPRALLGRRLADLCEGEDAAALAALLGAVPPRFGRAYSVFRLRQAGGHPLPVEVTLAPGARGETICVLRDVSRWQKAVAAARRSERNYELLAAHAGDMIVRVRPDRTRAYVSPSAVGVLGYPPEELRNLDFTAATHPEDRERVALGYDRIVHTGGQTTCRFRLRHKTRGFIWVESTWTTQPPDEPGQPCDVVAIVRDISERVAAEEQIAFLARHDPLTGLANRSLLAERTEQALAVAARGGTAAMLCFDLDLFKPVNDTFGHAAGDTLLRKVAERINGCVRPADTVARLGGDEFAVLQVGIDRANDAGRLATRLLSALALPFELEGQSVPVSASLGIAIAPTDGADHATLLRKADAALYRAKAEGRGRWRFFEPAMEAQRGVRDRLVFELRQALARGEFVLHYMPLVALDTEEIIGFKALLRWCHPERGLLPPAAFIGLAEETGLIAPIGGWVLSQACADAARWPDPLTVAVNLSASQLRDGTVAHTVSAALAAAGLRAGRLELEITETVLLDENATALAELHTLRRHGVRIALDDFGTGFASLGTLRRFPFDKIKLDRSFVHDIADQPDALAIARAVAGLGRSLGIAALAEGVETTAQRDLLRAEGYCQAQGFLYGHPGDRHAVNALLAARTRPAAPVTALAG
jgi:diguanylate cyclase (GGDEF)-like protein/PAS domain S-box-containing protein